MPATTPAGSGVSFQLVQFLNVSRVPRTEAATAACRDLLVDLIERTENRTRRRKPADQAAFDDCVSRVLGGLAHALETDVPLVRIVRNRNSYTSLPINYVPFMAVYAGLSRLGFIETVKRGFYAAGMGGHCEIIRATSRLADVLAFHDATSSGWTYPRNVRQAVETFNALEVRERRQRVAYENAAGRTVRSKRKTGPVVIPELTFSPEAKPLRQQVERLNAFMRDVDVQGCPPFHGWTRVFTETLDLGGRLYAHCPAGHGISYQTIPSEHRRHITLNGCETVEIDYRASHLFLFLAGRGVDLRDRMGTLGIDDPYALPDVSRQAVKDWTVTTLGAGRLLARWPDGKGCGTPIADVRAFVLDAYPELEQIEPDDGLRLQKVETDALLSAQLILAAHEVPSLGIHDSLIVPKDAEGLAVPIMREAMRFVAKAEPLGPRKGD